MIDHVCPFCERRYRGPVFFRHIKQCGRQPDLFKPDRDRFPYLQGWRVERRDTGDFYMVPEIPLRAQFKARRLANG